MKAESKDTLDLFKDVTLTEVSEYDGISDEMRSDLDNMYSYYFKVRDDLANNNSESARLNTQQLFDAAEKINSYRNPLWMEQESNMNDYRKRFDNATSIEDQRSLFNDYSNTLIDFIQAYGLPGNTVYVMESQNALQGSNGIWLNDGTNSLNPYGMNGDLPYNTSVLRGWKFEKIK